MLGLWLVVGVALAMGVASLLGDRGRRWWVERRLSESPRHCPPAAVIVPVKGYDEGLGSNLASLATLDYPGYELIVTARSLEDLPADVVPMGARVVFAGEGDSSTSEKITNLIAGIQAARPETEILAFADSDGQAGADWLRALVRGLEDDQAGAATGFRWHLPDQAGFWPLLRSVWNGVPAGGFGPGDSRLVWGGAMAMRRDLFEQLRIAEHWRGSLSDDYTLARVVKAAGLRVVYAPGAIVVSHDRTGAGEFLRWIQRQMIITRVYGPRLWTLGFIAHLIYCAAMAISAFFALQGNLIGLYTLIAQLLLSIWKGANRLSVARLALPRHREWFRRHGWIHIWLVPLGTWVWLYSFVASAMTNTVSWRGNRYRLSAHRVEKL